MANRFEHKLNNNKIKSYVILYHSQFANDNNHELANNDNELKAITVFYGFKDGLKGNIGLPYHFEKDEIKFQGVQDFSQEENNVIFSTTLLEHKDYFQDREEIKVPIFENEIGLKIKKASQRQQKTIIMTEKNASLEYGIQLRKGAFDFLRKN